MTTYFIPELSTTAGSCLTAQNLEEVGVTWVAYHLSALLMKPGIEVLRSGLTLGQYVGWHGNIVLNLASMPKPNSEGMCTIRSSYDGSKYEYTVSDLIDLIVTLSPKMVILPEAFYHFDWHLIPDSISIVFPVGTCSPDTVPGVYFDGHEHVSDDSIQEALKKQFVYVRGDFNPKQMKQLFALGVTYIESNQPADDAYHGRVYQKGQVFEVLADKHRLQFATIDSACQCPTCIQQFTYAYLHHLFQHTPLLCQRLLIQHNLTQVIADK